jgi:BolA protein
VAVSEAFTGLGLVARHRLVYGALAEEMAGPIHALTLDTKTPDEVAGK